MKALSQTAKTARIRELNDAFRSTFAGGKVVMTSGVDALPDMVKATALQKAATFDAFTDDNDPYGEHDFGSFELCSRRLADQPPTRCITSCLTPIPPDGTSARVSSHDLQKSVVWCMIR